MRYYGLQGRSGAHLPLNYQLLQIGDPIPTGTDVQDIIDEYLNNLPGAATADWLVSDNRKFKNNVNSSVEVKCEFVCRLRCSAAVRSLSAERKR